MNKKIKIIAASLLVTSALAACGTSKDKSAMDRNATYNYERTSYENAYPHRDNVAGTDRYTDYVTYRNDTRTDQYGNVKYTKINQDIHNRRDNVGYNYYRDVNYHGQMTNPYPTRNVTMNNAYINNDGKVAEAVSNRVKGMDNVDRVSTVVRGNDVVIAVKTRNNPDEKALENDIRKAVAPLVNNRNIYVTAKEDMFTRVDTMSTQLRNGTITNDLNRDVTNMFRDLRTNVTNVAR
ncbi:YhcN/YlaJ family sporulation lipoprotein [Bacillus cytotoxicus]|uniref:YhcN/YlaJ family sporulation lipoprotein n=1 Tax=Bacillus cytotoxicus TaxID=580165 RepID=A0ACC6A949_9BACI|nr:YhcN/YlaJ family sporulation lipoprotein [Bacillus cytotoxicus]